jgi:hypothetical protein
LEKKNKIKVDYVTASEINLKVQDLDAVTGSFVDEDNDYGFILNQNTLIIKDSDLNLITSYDLFDATTSRNTVCYSLVSSYSTSGAISL